MRVPIAKAIMHWGPSVYGEMPFRCTVSGCEDDSGFRVLGFGRDHLTAYGSGLKRGLLELSPKLGDFNDPKT